MNNLRCNANTREKLKCGAKLKRKCFLSAYKLRCSPAGAEFPDSQFYDENVENGNLTLKTMLALLTLGLF